MRKAFFYIHYAIKAGGLDMSKHVPTPPFDREGRPTFPTHRLSGEEFEAGKEMWKRVSPDGSMPKQAPFTSTG
jgi:hypothetical protein